MYFGSAVEIDLISYVHLFQWGTFFLIAEYYLLDFEVHYKKWEFEVIFIFRLK